VEGGVKERMEWRIGKSDKREGKARQTKARSLYQYIQSTQEQSKRAEPLMYIRVHATVER